MAIHEKSDLQDGGQGQPTEDGAVSSEVAGKRDTPASAVASTKMPDEHEIMRALKAVYDPELGISIVDLGLVYGVNVDEVERKVMIDMTLTTPACPLAPMIRTQAHAVLTSNFDAIRDVDVNLVWTPRWDPRTMASEEGKAELGIW